MVSGPEEDELTPDMQSVITLTDRLKAEMPRMLSEHKMIVEAGQIEDVSKPSPGAGQVLIRIGGARVAAISRGDGPSVNKLFDLAEPEDRAGNRRAK